MWLISLIQIQDLKVIQRPWDRDPRMSLVPLQHRGWEQSDWLIINLSSSPVTHIGEPSQISQLHILNSPIINPTHSEEGKYSIFMLLGLPTSLWKTNLRRTTTKQKAFCLICVCSSKPSYSVIKHRLCSQLFARNGVRGTPGADLYCCFQFSFTCSEGVICSAIFSLAAWGWGSKSSNKRSSLLKKTKTQLKLLSHILK